MHTAEPLFNTLLELRAEGRNKITNMDLSYNVNLDINTVIQILGHLPNLKKLTLKGMNFEYGQLPTQIFAANPLIKSLDISENNLVCARGVLGKLVNLKKMVYGGNPLLNTATGRNKAKKGKVTEDIATFNAFPKENCIYV